MSTNNYDDWLIYCKHLLQLFEVDTIIILIVQMGKQA